MKKLPSIFILLGTLLMSACNDSSSTTKNDTSEGSPPVSNTTSVVSKSGGTVTVTDEKSPIYGAKIEIADETIVQDETIHISYDDALPAPLNDQALSLGAKQVSKVLILERSGTTDFAKAVNVTIPYDRTLLPDDAVPVIVYWDPISKSYSPVSIHKIDREKGTITFFTAHASKYVVLTLDYLTGATEPDLSQFTYDVGFDPTVDSFFVHNFGSYDSPGGNCFGMAAYAGWYQHTKKSMKNQGLRSLYLEGDQNKEEDDQNARELIARVFQAGNQKAHIMALNAANDLGLLREQEERFIALTIIQQLIITQQAQILAMGVSGTNGFTDGHAVTVYAYNGTTKQFYYYDNNYPGEVVTVPWDWTNGFGNNTKNKAYDVYAFAAFNSAYSTNTLEALYNAAESGFSTSHYPKITISTPAVSTSDDNIYETSSADNIVITGSVPRPDNAQNPNAQRYLHVYLNGAHQSTSYPINQADNSFSINIASLPNPTGTDVMFFVSENSSAWAGGFHSFKEFTLRVQDQHFFSNLGFETGDFSNWSSVRYTWFSTEDSPDSITPSDKSAVVSDLGVDPIATGLTVPLFGKYAARVNNSDDQFHISKISQTAVVPAATNPMVRFYWSAVLEDPDHSPEDQPYIDIKLVDSTTGDTLYSKRFYSNDPSYSGWISYEYNGSTWRSIPWQLVEVPVAQYVGHSLLLTVEAADCAQGAHGGYAYIDAVE
jgi:hypothetical protein